MKLFNYLLATVVLLFFSFTNYETEISGKVIDGISKLGIQGVSVYVKGTKDYSSTDKDGNYKISVQKNYRILVFEKEGYQRREVKTASSLLYNVVLQPKVESPELGVVSESESQANDISFTMPSKKSKFGTSRLQGSGAPYQYSDNNTMHNTEEYSPLNENIFHNPLTNPLSTFSIDVDAASYSNMRRFINNGQKPPIDAIRIEEMINYFDYDYEQPTNEKPFSINTEIAQAPWNREHLLVHVGLQGKKIEMENLPASNIVFLLDVSGSMNQPSKLPLLKSSLKLLVNELRPQDKVAIVVYAGAAGLVLPSTPGNNKSAIIQSLDNLNAGGSTAGGAGINLAYKIAQENFVKNGNNRIVLATDGDFNVGASSNGEMQRLIEEKRKNGVFLTVLGFGMGNYKDSKMEILADKGNGNYAYIDNIMEAKKVLVNEFGGTLFTIAKDVKIQVEFNPSHVQAYRLIGYENRLLRDEDFNNDKIDAGEIGSGHSVTALYEIIPVGVKSSFTNIDPLKYQSERKTIKSGDEIMNIKFRYKKPDENVSMLIEEQVNFQLKKSGEMSENYKWSASVAMFGMYLRNSEFKGETDLNMITSLAQSAKGIDSYGYRAEFIQLVKAYEVVN